MSLNVVVMMGRLTKDPELRRTSSGIACASASIAVDRDFAGKGKEKETDFFEVVAWRHTAEFFSKYFTKGRTIVVKGRLQNRSWVDKQENKHTRTEIIADDGGIYFGDSKPMSGGSTAPASTNSASNYATGPSHNAAPSTYNGSNGYVAPSAYNGSARQYPNDFAMLDDDDAQLPF